MRTTIKYLFCVSILVSGLHAIQIRYARGERDASPPLKTQVCPSLLYLNVLFQQEAVTEKLNWNDGDKAVVAHTQSVIECRENEQEDDETHSFGNRHGQSVASVFFNLFSGDVLSRLHVAQCHNNRFLPSARYLVLQVIRI